MEDSSERHDIDSIMLARRLARFSATNFEIQDFCGHFSTKSRLKLSKSKINTENFIPPSPTVSAVRIVGSNKDQQPVFQVHKRLQCLIKDFKPNSNVGPMTKMAYELPNIQRIQIPNIPNKSVMIVSLHNDKSMKDAGTEVSDPM